MYLKLKITAIFFGIDKKSKYTIVFSKAMMQKSLSRTVIQEAINKKKNKKKHIHLIYALFSIIVISPNMQKITDLKRIKFSCLFFKFKNICFSTHTSPEAEVILLQFTESKLLLNIQINK